MDKLEATLGRLPQFYDREDTSSNLYKLIKAFVDELDIVSNDISKVDNMVGIGSTGGSDLEYRWGSLFMLPRYTNETDEAYMNRLKLSLTSLSGGTADALQYSIAVGLGVNNDQESIDRIKIYDAWDYPGTGVPTEYGNIVCTVDLNNREFDNTMEDIIIASANSVKATGTQITLIFFNYRILYYIGLDDITYTSLDSITYNQIGE